MISDTKGRIKTFQQMTTLIKHALLYEVKSTEHFIICASYFQEAINKLISLGVNLDYSYI